MHNFGEKRWRDGIIDDIRSQTEPNTRVVGDFTKVRDKNNEWLLA